MSVPGAIVPVPVPVVFMDREPDGTESVLFRSTRATPAEAFLLFGTGLNVPAAVKAANLILAGLDKLPHLTWTSPP